MPRSIPVLVAAIVLSLSLQAAAETGASREDHDPRVIVVSGSGEASAKPDVATLNFTVLRSGETARTALDAANAAMQRVINGMRKLGAADKDLQTSGFSINPQYRADNRSDGSQNPPEIVGYDVRNSLTVTVHDMAGVGEYLDRAVSLGVNQGGDISFGVDDPQAVRDEARREAIAKARSSAAVLAEAAGVRLGRILSISQPSAGNPPMPYQRSMKMMAAEAASSVPVEAGENRFSETVQMVFEIQD
ncbi:SIMPL domain-containing protein [Aurantimonas sp. VKM B-3413]|uniref:SIMPL domain-containing protein n=1 Tax=Aurantimonas sp. VKM B-3413 TaxID=2779401 RepID=UPI001E2C48CF|nr:SIMPL domain-containing protein [Aurantimonas sp. VKM B-3413]MCB8837211.1 SIMPL domain-containing protein [Aurantimonas sp. VKM B-3413]